MTREQQARAEGRAGGIANQASLHAIARGAAEQVLLRHGARIIERGWTCPEGSVDFIAMKDGVLVFADAYMVESTASEDMERPVPGETVYRWERVAYAFASQATHELPDMRFDAISVAERPDGSFLTCHQINVCVLTAVERNEMSARRECGEQRQEKGKEDGNEVEGDSHSEPKRRRGKDYHHREPGRGAR